MARKRPPGGGVEHVWINVRIPAGLKAQIRRVASERGYPASTWVRIQIEQAVQIAQTVREARELRDARTKR